MTVTSYDDKAICDAALTMLGEGAINSFENPKTDIEAACSRIWPLVKSTLLSSFAWNFANPVRQLAVNVDATDELRCGYAYAFRLPSDLLAGPFAVYANGDRQRPISDYENANDHILCNASVVHVRYRKTSDISTWPLYFVDLCVVALAARLAKPIADNTALAQEYRILAFGPADMDGEGGMFKNAKSLDAKAQPMRSIFQNGDPLTATRY